MARVVPSASELLYVPRRKPEECLGALPAKAVQHRAGTSRRNQASLDELLKVAAEQTSPMLPRRTQVFRHSRSQSDREETMNYRLGFSLSLLFGSGY